MDFGKATVCPPGYKPNKNWKRKPGQKQCIKVKSKPSLKQLQALAKANDVSIYKRRKDNMGFTRTPLSMKALKLRLTKMKVPYSFGLGMLHGGVGSLFGKATVCPPGYKPNKNWKRKPGQKQCIKERPKKMTLKQLQALAKANDVSIYKRRKDNMGFTRTPLSMKALKLRLTKMKVPYSFGFLVGINRGRKGWW